MARAAKSKPKDETETAEDFEATQDELQALALGAENMDDLQALLEGRGIIATVHGTEEAEGGYQMGFLFVDEDDEPVPDQQPRSWRSIAERAGDIIAQRSLANWILRKRQARLAEIAEKQQFAEQRLDEIREWLDREVSWRERAIGWCEDMLLRWHRAVGTKQESLPAGKLAWEKCRVETEWDLRAALTFALREATVAADEAVSDLAAYRESIEADDPLRAMPDDQLHDLLWSDTLIDVLSKLVEIKKTPIKDRLLKRADGSRWYANEDGEPVTVISVHLKGEVPMAPLADGADPETTERKPLEWCQPGEDYHQVIKAK